MNHKEEKMFDQLQKMLETPQAREMMFNMIAQQVAQAPSGQEGSLIPC